MMPLCTFAAPTREGVYYGGARYSVGGDSNYAVTHNFPRT